MLVERLSVTGPEIDAAVAEGDFAAGIAAAAALGPPVDAFFDDVLVMAEDESIRANRLRLLLDVRDAVGRLGTWLRSLARRDWRSGPRHRGAMGVGGKDADSRSYPADRARPRTPHRAVQRGPGLRSVRQALVVRLPP